MSSRVTSATKVNCSPCAIVTAVWFKEMATGGGGAVAGPPPVPAPPPQPGSVNSTTSTASRASAPTLALVKAFLVCTQVGRQLTKVGPVAHDSASWARAPRLTTGMMTPIGATRRNRWSSCETSKSESWLGLSPIALRHAIQVLCRRGEVLMNP